MSEWIKCDERLPQTPYMILKSELFPRTWFNSDPVFVCGYTADRKEGITYGIARYMTTVFSDGEKESGWDEPLDDTGADITEVIAWMPIESFEGVSE